MKTFTAPRNLALFGFTAVLGMIAVLIIGINIYQRLNATGPYRDEFEGRVIDKSATVRETETGSAAVRRLLIREASGTQLYIIVDQDLYERAKIGMWIKRDKNTTDVSWNTPEDLTASPQNE